MKKKIATLCMLSLLSMLLLAGCGNKEKKNNPNYNPDTYLSGTYCALIDVENFGEIYVELYADIAPATVTNFIRLAEDGFYDGLTFHRIIEDFMIQGGDPAGDGTGRATYTVPGEFAENGFENSLSHERGTISMARAEGYDSASSQFFIVHQDTKDLDGHYAAFGKVIAGMEVVDLICANTKVEDEDGTVLKANQPVINFVYVLDSDDILIQTDQDKVKEEPEEPELPDATATITLSMANTEEVPPVVADNWVVNEDGQTYYLSSSEDLLSLAIYEIDLTSGIEYDVTKPLAYSSDLAANDYLSMTITVPEDLTILLVAEEHNGALGQYLLGYDKNNNTAYLIPVL